MKHLVQVRLIQTVEACTSHDAPQDRGGKRGSRKGGSLVRENEGRRSGMIEGWNATKEMYRYTQTTDK